MFPPSKKRKGGESFIFSMRSNIPMTTSKQTKLGKGGGSTLVPPFGGNTESTRGVFNRRHAIPEICDCIIFYTCTWLLLFKGICFCIVVLSDRWLCLLSGSSWCGCEPEEPGGTDTLQPGRCEYTTASSLTHMCAHTHTRTHSHAHIQCTHAVYTCSVLSRICTSGGQHCS